MSTAKWQNIAGSKKFFSENQVLKSFWFVANYLIELLMTIAKIQILKREKVRVS